MKGNLEQATGLELPSTLVFDYPSMKELAEYLLQQLPAPASMPPPTVPEAASANIPAQIGLPRAGASKQAAAAETAQSSAASAAAGPAWGPMSPVQRLAYFQQQVG